MKRYFPSEIESKWQKKWQEQGLYNSKFDSKKQKYYNLVELPYPSGDLHIGHWFSFVPPDTHARYKRMSGFNVFFPNGFDAFGLPAENAAIKRGIHPKDWTMKNIETMTKQFQTMGTMIDWNYTAITCLPEYYRWNQWIFLKMFEKGLAYRGMALSNWCPSCNTVVANENIEAGKCWRCGSEVIQKEIEQWFLRITDYADQLIWKDDPAKDGVNWPKQVREGQNNWIGKSEGMLLKFPISDANSQQSRFSDDVRPGSALRSSSELDDSSDASTPAELGARSPAATLMKTSSHRTTPRAFDTRDTFESELPPVSMANSKLSMVNSKSYIEVFTTRPETTDGATFMVVAPEHEFVAKLLTESRIKNQELRAIEKYVEAAKKKTEMERKEDRTKSGKFSGKYVKNPVTGKDIPVWVSDYVLAGYGTGAIMAVPFADERDKEFAEKFNLPIVETSFKAKPDGQKKVNYHLHDWSISRQRYWGTPIPVIHCRECWEVKSQKSKVKSKQGSDYSIIDGKEYAMVAVPYEDLPVELPYNVDYTPKGKPPLATDEEWLNVKCPKCGGKAKRDAETLDTFFDSAWYYYRYTSPNFDKEPFDKLKVKELLPVDVYFGGSEHTLGHTLYARFFTKFFKDLGLVSFDEFASKRVQHGVILGPDGNRMSKSKGNVVNPDEIVKEYGADTVRLYLCFMMPYEATAPWSQGAISGIYRFLKRVWDLQSAISNLPAGKAGQPSAISSEDLFQMHNAIKKVGEDLGNFHFNTGVAALMTWLNFLSAKNLPDRPAGGPAGRQGNITEEEYETFLKLLSPFAPHITEEIWQLINPTDNSIHLEKWPEFNPQYLVEDKVSIVVQVNGRVRDTIRVESSKLKVQSYVVEAGKSEKVKKYLEGKQINRVIYVEGKIINFVISN